jgi:ADP-heptose:LPS heptosyltransferase
MADNGRPRRVLAVKLADLGDILLCEPALRSLRVAFPHARIDVLVPPTSAQLVPLLDPTYQTIAFPKQMFDDAGAFMSPTNVRTALRLARSLRRVRYDRVVFFHHLTTPGGARKFRLLAAAIGRSQTFGLDNGRGKFLKHAVSDCGFGMRHESEYMLAVAHLAGGAEVSPFPRFPLGSIDTSIRVPESFVAIFPVTGAYSDAREWHPERFAELAEQLRATGLDIVVLGAADASTAAQRIVDAVPNTLDLTGKTSIPQLAGVLTRAEVVVGGDSFIGHLAAAVGRPVVSIFGPSNSAAWRPCAPRSEARVVRADIPCAPCLYSGYSLGRRYGCPTRTCLDLVTVAMVKEGVMAALGAAK